MTIQAGQRNVVAGQSVAVPIWMINGTDVANINFEVRYNPAVAVAEGAIQRGSFFPGLVQGNAGESGIVRIGAAQTTASSGTASIAWVRFNAVGRPGDRTDLSLSVSTINNPGGATLTIDKVDGLVQIVDANGILPGDCDGNGRVTEADALCALQMSVRLIPAQMTLDLDRDQNVTSRDATLLLQKAIGK
jgi:hypothetical protein